MNELIAVQKIAQSQKLKTLVLDIAAMMVNIALPIGVDMSYAPHRRTYFRYSPVTEGKWYGEVGWKVDWGPESC